MMPEEKKIQLDGKKMWALHRPEFESLANKAFFFSPFGDEPKPSVVDIIDGVAIINIKGHIFRYHDEYIDWMGGSSIERLTEQFESMVLDDAVKAIILNVNSCGGEVDGTPELAETIFTARGIKPIIAYVSSLGASAAYWLASAADKIVVHEAAAVGSIGVYGTFYRDRDDERELTIVSSVSPNKLPDLNSSDGIAQVQRFVDQLGAIFIRNVAKHRGLSEQEVLQNFGQGDVRIGADAVAFKMADQMGSLKSIQNELKGGFIMGGPAAATPTVNAEMIDPVDITKEYIDKNFPDIAEEFRKEGEDRERKRIEDMETNQENAPDGNTEEAKAFFHSAKFDRKISAGDAVSEFLKLSAEKKNKIVADRNSDAAGIPAVTGSAADVDSEEDEKQKQITESIRAGIKKGRK